MEIAANYQGEQVIIVPEDDSISFNLTLPKTALRSLEQLMESEIQRQTPFNASEVNLSYEITSINNGEVSIEVQIVPKLTLNELIDKAKTFGLTPSIAIVNRVRISEAENINFFQKTEPNKSFGGISKILGVALLILITAAIVSPFIERHISIEKAELINQSLKNQIKTIQLNQRELAHLKKDAQTIRKFSQERHEIIDLLESISKSVPDSAWLSRYSSSNNTITLQGFAKDTSEVLTELAKIKTLSVPTLQSPIIKDLSKNLERFHIRANIL
jgi:general secretion pathway protein L